MEDGAFNVVNHIEQYSVQSYEDILRSRMSIGNSYLAPSLRHSEDDRSSITDDSALNDLPSDGEPFFQPVGSSKHVQRKAQFAEKQSSTNGFVFQFVGRQTCHSIENELKTSVSDLNDIAKVVAQLFNTDASHVHNIPVQLHGLPVFILAPELAKRYLFIRFQSIKPMYCIQVHDPDSLASLEKALENIVGPAVNNEFDESDYVHRFPYDYAPIQGYYTHEYQFQQLEYERLQRSRTHGRNVQKTVNSGRCLQLLFNQNKLTPADALQQDLVPNFSILELIISVRLEWRIYHRYKLMCDRRYIVRCQTSDTLAEMKQKFWNVYRVVENEKAENCNISSIWLTQHDKLITDAVLKESFGSIKNGSQSVDAIMLLNQRRAVLRLHSFSGEQGSSGMLYIDDVFVHFQPADAVPVSVVFKDEDKKNPSEFSTLTVLSPQSRARDLREDVSKVLREEAGSIRILVGNTKLHHNTDLSKELSMAGCKIVVKPKAKITLTVYVSKVPQAEIESTWFVFAVYAYDTLHSLKRQVSQKSGVHQYQIDLLFQGRPLDETNSFSEHRIKDKDTLEARVYVNRLMIPVRLPNRRIYDLLVDDCKSFTVGHIKAFARTVDGVEPFHNCEVSAILKDRVVADNDILGDIMADVEHGAKLVLARTESECFTAATSFEGTLRVFKLSSDGSHFQHILGLSSGRRLLCDPSICAEDDEFESLVQNRRQSELAPAPVPGIHIIPNHDDLSELRGHRYKSITSRFSSPTPSVSSMTTMHPHDNLSSRTSPKLRDDCKEQELPKMPPKSCLAKRRSSVRFHTGNSAANLEELGSGISPTGDAAATPGQLEEDSGSTLAEDEEEEDEEQTPGRQQRSKSDSSRITAASGEESGEHRRPKSCPAVPANRASILQFPIVPRCDSDSGLSRITHISEDLRRDKEGHYIYRQAITSEARLTPDLVTPDFVQKNLKNVSGSLSHTVVAVPPILPVPQIRDQQCQALVSPTDPAYKYVKECVIRFLAHHLGDNGNRFIRALEVPQTEIDSANNKYPRDMFEKYFHLLRYWLTMSGSNATVHALRDVLVTVGRKDMADEIEKLDIPPAAPEPSSLEQARSPATPDRPGPDVDAVD